MPPVRAEVTATSTLVMHAAADLKSAQETRAAMDILHEAGGSAPSAASKRKATGVVKSKMKVLKDAEETLARLKADLDVLGVKRASLGGDTTVSDLTELEEDDPMEGVEAAPVPKGRVMPGVDVENAGLSSSSPSTGREGSPASKGEMVLGDISRARSSPTANGVLKDGAALGVSAENMGLDSPGTAGIHGDNTLAMPQGEAVLGVTGAMVGVEPGAIAPASGIAGSARSSPSAANTHSDNIPTASQGGAMLGVVEAMVGVEAGAVASAVDIVDKTGNAGLDGAGITPALPEDGAMLDAASSMVGVEDAAINTSAMASTVGAAGTATMDKHEDTVVSAGVAEAMVGIEPGAVAQIIGAVSNTAMGHEDAASASVADATAAAATATSAVQSSDMLMSDAADVAAWSATVQPPNDPLRNSKLKASEVLKKRAKEIREEIKAQEKAERKLARAEKKAAAAAAKALQEASKKKPGPKAKGSVKVNLKNEDGTLEVHNLHKIDGESEGEDEGNAGAAGEGEADVGGATVAHAKAATADASVPANSLDNMSEDEIAAEAAKGMQEIQTFLDNPEEVVLSPTLRKRIREYSDFLPEAVTISRKLSLHILTTTADKTWCLWHHLYERGDKGKRDYQGRDKFGILLTGVPGRSARGESESPDEGCLNCGCTIDDSLWYLIFWKTWTVSSKGGTVVETWKRGHLNPRLRSLVVRGFKKLSCLTLKDMFVGESKEFFGMEHIADLSITLIRRCLTTLDHIEDALGELDGGMGYMDTLGIKKVGVLKDCSTMTDAEGPIERNGDKVLWASASQADAAGIF